MSTETPLTDDVIAAAETALVEAIHTRDPNDGDFYKTCATDVLEAAGLAARLDALHAENQRLREDRDFWKDNDNKRSANVRQARAERDALRAAVKAQLDKWSQEAEEWNGPDWYLGVETLEAALSEAGERP